MRAKLIMFSIMTACTLGSCESILEIDPISEITMEPLFLKHIYLIWQITGNRNLT